MNAADNEFSGQAVDGLINYEVVKAFANEGFEARRLDRALETYEKAAVKSQLTLSFLNAGQACMHIESIYVPRELAEEFTRIGKGGRKVHIQASYNPIFDMNGRVFKVVKFATDVTGRVESVEALAGGLHAPAAG